MESKESKEVVEQEHVQSPFKKDIADSDVTLIGDKPTIC